jgi:hypothetical protein
MCRWILVDDALRHEIAEEAFDGYDPACDRSGRSSLQAHLLQHTQEIGPPGLFQPAPGRQ